MADKFLTMYDLAKLNGASPESDLIEENLQAAPECAVFPARTIAGTTFSSAYRVSLPSGSFRDANEGVFTSASKFELRQFQTKYFDLQLSIDTKIAKGHSKGAANLLATEEIGAMLAYMQYIGSQIWYGAQNDAKGFPGAINLIDSSLLLDATGSAANTGSSVYAVCLGEDRAEILFGNNEIMQMGDWRKQTVQDGNKKSYTAWKNSMEGEVGCAWQMKYCVARIKNLTAQAGKGCTDSLLAQLLGKFPKGIKPDCFFMSRRTCTQLQLSRTPVTHSSSRDRLDSSTPATAPRPTDYANIPIYETDSLLDTEAIV